MLSGCAAKDETMYEMNDVQIMQPSQAEKQDTFLSDTEDINYEYITEELYAERAGNRIYGVVYIPQDAGEQMPAVIFSHGFGGNYQVGTQYAKALAEKGYVDKNNIFLIGTSQGGAVSAITAVAHQEEIRGAILLYPAFCLVDQTKERFASVDDIPDTYFSLWMTIGRAYAENLLDYDIYEAISGYEKDVLILHGDADSIVPLSYSEKALDIYSSARLEVFPGAGHGFYGEDAQRAINLVLEYLESHRDK